MNADTLTEYSCQVSNAETRLKSQTSPPDVNECTTFVLLAIDIAFALGGDEIVRAGYELLSPMSVDAITPPCMGCTIPKTRELLAKVNKAIWKRGLELDQRLGTSPNTSAIHSRQPRRSPTKQIDRYERAFQGFRAAQGTLGKGVTHAVAYEWLKKHQPESLAPSLDSFVRYIREFERRQSLPPG